jgi:hypothetical protein
MELRAKIFTAIMNRYGGYVNLRHAMGEDEDTVVCNLYIDLNCEVEETEILNYIIQAIGYRYN